MVEIGEGALSEQPADGRFIALERGILLRRCGIIPTSRE